MSRTFFFFFFFFLQRFPNAELNIEGNPFYGLMQFAETVRPVQCTLVPDEPDVFTSNQGWDVRNRKDDLREVVAQLHEWGCRVSLFMDPDPEAMRSAAETGADRVELYTEPYAAGFAAHSGIEEVVEQFAAAARSAIDNGLQVNAGHDLNQENLLFFLQRVPGVAEVSIGHALIADALELGLAETVRRYQDVIQQAGESNEL